MGNAFEKGICAKNHLIAGENAYEIKGRNPVCKTCHLERQRRYDQARAELRRARRQERRAG